MSDEQTTGRIFAALSKSPLEDAGFACPASAISTLSAQKAKRSEAARLRLIEWRRGAVQNLLKAFEKSVEAHGGIGAINHQSALLGSGVIEDELSKIGVIRHGGGNVTEHQLLKCVELILDLLELALFGCGHGGDSPEGGEPDLPTPGPVGAHRLSEASK